MYYILLWLQVKLFLKNQYKLDSNSNILFPTDKKYYKKLSTITVQMYKG